MEIQTSLHTLIESVYGVKTRHFLNRQVSAVGTSVVKIINNDPKRVGFTIINLSAADMYIGPDNQVSSSRGIYLAAGGGSITVKWDVDFHLVAHEWYAVSASASSDIYCLELTLV